MSAITWDHRVAEVRGPRRAGRPALRRATPAGSSVAPREVAAPVRLTARGRLAVVVLTVLVGFGAALGADSASADGPGDPIEVATHTVAAGETLWQIAGSVAAPGQDIRDVVDELVALNELHGAGLQAGQQILVPAD